MYFFRFHKKFWVFVAHDQKKKILVEYDQQNHDFQFIFEIKVKY